MNHESSVAATSASGCPARTGWAQPASGTESSVAATSALDYPQLGFRTESSVAATAASGYPWPASGTKSLVAVTPASGYPWPASGKESLVAATPALGYSRLASGTESLMAETSKSSCPPGTGWAWQTSVGTRPSDMATTASCSGASGSSNAPQGTPTSCPSGTGWAWPASGTRPLLAIFVNIENWIKMRRKSFKNFSGKKGP